MKTKILLFLKLSRKIAFFLFTLFTVNTFAQITGTHSVGSGQEYETIQEAVDSLVSQGVSGHVVFNLVDATYNEQVTIVGISGTDADSTITFQSSTLNPENGAVYFDGTSENNYVLHYNGCDFVTFQYLTINNTSSGDYTRVIRLNGTAQNNSIKNNILTSRNVDNYDYYGRWVIISCWEDDVSNLTIEDNNFSGGSYSISIDGSASKISDSILIKNNIIDCYRNMFIEYANAVEISGNEIYSEYNQGIYLNYCDNSIKITSNKIFASHTSSHSGLHIDNCDGTSFFTGLIANNFIVIDGNSGQNNHGIIIEDSQHQNVYNNTIHVLKSDTDNGALYVNRGDDIEVVNNNLVNSDKGYAIQTSSTNPITLSDHNNLFVTGNILANWAGATYNDLAHFQTTGSDQNSLSVYPSFVSETDLHVQTHWLSGVGTNTTQGEVPTDIDGETRDASTPDIGADEFVPTNTTTYTGNLTINSAGGGDFLSFSEAVDSLKKLGVSGSVTIGVADGTYNEQFSMPDIPGVSVTNTIVFESASHDSTAVTLTFENTSENTNYLVNFSGADYITFKQMTFTPLGATYGRIISLTGYAHNNSIINNIFNGSGSASSVDDRAILFSENHRTDNLLVQNNIFKEGSWNIFLDGISTSDYTSGLEISNNTFENSYRNIGLLNQTDFEINSNTITGFSNTGIRIEYCLNPYTVKSNTLSTTNSNDQAMYINYCTGATGSLVYNNFLHINHSSSIYGLYISNSTYQKIYHNNINVVGANTDNRAFCNYLSTHTTVKNNIFCSDGNGFAYYNTVIDGSITSNHNSLYSTGTNIGYWGQNAVTLSDFQTISSQDANSKNVYPDYTSENDLHINSYWLDGAGTAIAEVTTDIDGENREDPPDIGADEYTSTITPLSGSYTVGSGGDYADIESAVNDLASNGITSTVTFNILTGTYNVQFSIPQVTGVSETDTIVFQSSTGNPDDVTVSYTATSATDNYIVNVDGADYVTLKNLTFQTGTSEFSRIVVFNGSSNNINLTGNVFNGRSSSTSSDNDAVIISKDNNPVVNNILIQDNTITNGSYGIYLCAISSIYSENIRVINNTINSFYLGIYIRYSNGPYIELNEISFSIDQGIGIYLHDCPNSSSSGITILKNTIFSNSRTYYGGIYILNCVENASYKGLIANNTVRLSSHNLSYSYGIYLNGSDYINIYYNSVNITCNNWSDIAFYANSCDYLDITNNNFAIRGDIGTKYGGHGRAIVINGNTGTTSDYNNLYSPGRYMATAAETNYTNLSALQAGTGQETHSTSYFPAYLSSDNLKTNTSWLDGTGFVLSAVTEDIEGTTRDVTNPDIGAYEYTSTETPMSGTYTLGSSGDIPSFDSLANALTSLGISAPVTIDILSGVYYDVHITFKDIPGVNSSDTVLIKSQTGNADNVTIGYTQDQNNNYIILLNGADYISFKDLTFSSGGTTYTRIFALNGNSNKVNIMDCSLNGISHNSSDGNKDLIYISADHIVDSLLISGNTFAYNSYGIRYFGYPEYNLKSIQIKNNIFNNQYRSIYIYETDGPIISGNEFNNAYQRSIYIHYCDEDLQILNNKIYSTYDENYAIFLHYCDGTTLNKGLIANNFIYGDGTGWDAFGIILHYCTYQRIYHNSVNITGTNDGSAFHNYNGGSNMVMNNVFINTGNGYAYNCNNSTGVTVSDYNDIYTTGNLYAHYNGAARANLAELQAASNKDSHSLEVEPGFTTATDMHLITDSLVGKAVPLSEVPTDFDGEERDATNPDIGADEFSCAFYPGPTAENVSVCSGETIPSLFAEGTNIRWYADSLLTNLLFSANEYNTGQTASGTYTYYVTQSNTECTSPATIVTLEILPSPIIDAVITNIDCEGNDYGTINLTISGGTEPYYFEWSNEEITEDITNLTEGIYYVTVSDANGCYATDSFSISQPEPIILTLITTDTDCLDSIGSATVTASGGLPPYEYQWSNGDTVAVISNLASGIYIITVTDANGCSNFDIATINDLGGPVITVNAFQDVSCYGNNDGAISIGVTGGTTPYNYEWSNGETTADISNLYSGPYELQVVDDAGCFAFKSVEISEPEPINISLAIFESSCGLSTGSAVATVSGGTGEYTYIWSTGATTTSIEDLNLGVYSLSVTDENSCVASKIFAISEIGAPTIGIDSIVEGTCGNSDGAIYITAYGSADTYSYNWSNGSTDEDLIGVNPGTYNVTVSDGSGCDAVEVATIESDRPPVNPICLVTVDSLTNHNLIVWEKLQTTDISAYNVYKESTQSGRYFLIAEWPFDNLSIFEDTLSNSLQRSWRYKLSVVDICGVESELSAHHKTMHLTINLGINNTVNLIWDHYEGFDFETYYIHRYSEDEWELIDSIPNNLTSYTDFSPPESDVLYQIEIKHPTGCSATKATNKNSSRSNVSNT
ncbi:MAG: right-handed parallel beta-helix repeat-containing protein, partial [Bacteroidales bacterium]|nr:right-handed parallel beta-helix repeat-containing protein [Bacteroidales bacterium]